MPAIDNVWLKAQRDALAWLQTPAAKKILTLTIILVSIYYAIDRIYRARQRERLRHTTTATGIGPGSRAARPNTGTATAANTAVTRLLSSITQSAAQSSQPKEALTPVTKYLSPSTVRRSVIVASECVDVSNDSVVRVLRLLATHCKLVIVHQTSIIDTHSHTDTDFDSEGRLLASLESVGLLGADADQIDYHRILTCTTEKGKIATIRQIEPSLLIESSAAVVSSVKPFLVDIISVDSGSAMSKYTVPALTHVSTVNGLNLNGVGQTKHATRTVDSVRSIEQYFYGGDTAAGGDGKDESISESKTPNRPCTKDDTRESNEAAAAGAPSVASSQQPEPSLSLTQS